MASGEHSVARFAVPAGAEEEAFSRRDLLGAAVAGVIVPASASSRGAERGGDPGLDCFAPLAMTEGRGRARWTRTLAAVRRAEGDMRGAEAACSAPGLAIEAVFALEEVYGDRIVAFNRALARLLAAPAPDLAALAAKIALASDYEAVTLNGCETCLQALKADAMRLAQSGTLRQVQEGNI